MNYNRYDKLMENGKIKIMPHIKLNKKRSDREEIYRSGVSRLDLISYKYYDNANYGWLILLANPELPSLEFMFEDNSLLRIPYPLDVSIEDYINKLNLYYKINEL